MCIVFSCSSGAEDDVDDPGTKAVRERERRQANNVRERYVITRYLLILFFFFCIFLFPIHKCSCCNCCTIVTFGITNWLNFY